MKGKGEVLRHIPELDGVRGIAVLAVMAAHFEDPVSRFMPLGWLSKVIDHGGAGVDLFFVLSGFLITGILVSTKESTNYFRTFYARRAVRIFPLYFLVVGLFFLVFVPLAQHHGKDLWINPQEQIWYWLFLANWRHAFGYNDGAQLAHFWSLAIEEQFYLVWAVVIWLANHRWIKILSVAVPIAVIAFRTMAAMHGVGDDFLYFSTVSRLDTLGLGALLAVSRPVREFFGQYGLSVLGLAVVGSMFKLPLALLFTVDALGAAALVGLACSRPVPLLRTGWLRTFGKYSYGLYVIHYLIHGGMVLLATRMNHRVYALLAIPFGIGLSSAAAWVSWNVLENPFLKLKRHFRYEWKASL